MLPARFVQRLALMSRAFTVQLVAAGLVALTLSACGGSGAPMAPPPRAVVEPVPIAGLAPATLTLPNSPNSVKFAVIGDSGRGNQAQRDVAAQMARYHRSEERRVGKECRSRWSRYHGKSKQNHRRVNVN